MDKDVEVKMEAAFAIATARDRSLQLLLEFGDREIIKLAWCLAYMDGVSSAYERVQRFFEGEKS